jgi:hypothetical protein
MALGSGLFLQARAQQSIPPPTGKITPWAAIKIAVAHTPGQALNANFEFDEGKWVYGVMIVTRQGLKEVELDPNTGKVGDVESITPEGEAKETAQELRAALKRAGVSASVGAERSEAGEKN